MSFIAHLPHPPLSNSIECLWIVKDQVPYRREKILPTGTIELMINFGSAHRLIDKRDEASFNLMNHSWIAGFQTEYLINEPVAETFMLGVRFKPGGAYPFFDFPISEMSNRVIDMRLIWGRDVEEIRERLLAAPTHATKFHFMETILLARLNLDCYGLDAVHYAVYDIASNDGILSIRELSERMGISQKHLDHQFKKMVGVSPKSLARVMKLQRVLNSINPLHPINWADIAYSNHYYDQAHFNRDFAAFTGLTPTAYVDLRAGVFGELQPGEEVHFVPVG